MQVIVDDRCWTLFEDDTIAGFMMLDLWGNVSDVIICPPEMKHTIARQQRTLQVLQVVVSYALQHAVAEHGGVSIRPEISSPPQIAGSVLQEVGVLPEVASKTVEELTDGLSRWNVNISTDETEALVAIVRQVCGSMDMGMSFALSGQQTTSDYRVVTFIAPEGWQFCGWMNVQVGDMIIPSDHPMLHNIQRAVSINGSTDSLLSGRAVCHINAPEGSFSSTPGIATWQYVTYPFCAVGRRINIKLSVVALARLEGMQELYEVLSALLGLNNMYVGVWGGFSSPYDTSVNVAKAVGMDLSHLGGRPRGQEGWCVWAYRVLANEDRLDTAHIPSWFIEEGWLAAYEQYGQ